MTEYLTATHIAAPAERVWAVLTDASAYSTWNPEIIRIDGVIAANARITAHVRLGSGAVRRVPQRISVLEAPRRMEWIGGLPFGLFIGRRTFTVTPATDGTEFQMHLQMTGPLARWILKSVGDRQPEIDTFARSLKLCAEGHS
jgi:uncharacterized protein YndB with AHSA1/START domain